MAVSKQAMRNAINGYQKQGLGTRQIHIALAKRKDAIGASYRDDMQHGTPEEFNSVFGLKLSKGVTAGEVNKNASLVDKAASYGTSALMGLSDVGAGVVQGGYYLSDKAGLTKGAYDKYNKEYDKANGVAEVGRRQAGRKGTDLVRTGTAIAATVPMFIAGDKTAAARGLGLTGKVLTQSGIGATVGAANYAKDGKERISNTVWGGVGAGVGEAGGYLLGKGVSKGYNALKGNLKPEYQAVESLGKKFNVRTSAGDTMRKSNVLRNTETNLERVPLGMGKFRQGQNAEAKTAADKLVGKLGDNLNATEYKALNRIQTAAANGDRNANRVMGIVNSAQTPDEILQASLEVKQFRDKSVASKLYDQVGEQLKGLPNTTVTPNKTKALLNSKIDELSKSLAPDSALTKDLSKIKANFDNPNVTTDFNNMRLLRSQLGDLADKYAQGTNPNKSASKFFGDMRQAVESDITDFVASTGNDGIKKAYQRADAFYSNMVKKQDRNLAKAMQSDKPDEIYNQFVKMGKGDRAANFYNALDQKGQAALRLKMADEAFGKAFNEQTNVFSPAKFAGEFERLSEPYGMIFKGADKAEMDGFVKLMRHVERAGQYMENPPTGVRLTDIAMVGGAATNPILTAKIGGASLLAKTMFTTKAGKNLLMAASKLPEGSKGLANVLKAAETVMAASGAQAGISDSQPTDTQPTIEAQPVDTQPSIDAPVTQDSMPPLQVGDHLAPQQTVNAVTADMPQMDVPPMTQADAPSLPPVAPQGGFEPMPSDIVPSASETPVEPQQAQPTAINAVGQTLQSLIPPPKDTADPRKMATYEQVAQQAVVSVLNTPQMHQITTELESNAPSDSKIQSLQKSLSKTPEWQSFLQTLPKDQRQQLSSADVLSLITRNVSRNDSPVFNPQF